MLARLARAFESFFGAALAPSADFFRGVAQVVLVGTILFAVARAASLLRAFRYGWEWALVVRCPRCGALASDPASSECPSGHPIRFPPRAAAREARRRRFARLRRAAAAWPAVPPTLLALAAAVGYRICGVARVEGALATLTACVGYLFFAGAAVVATLAISADRRGAGERVLLGGVAALVVVPALALGLLARGFEPPRPRAIGSVWATPTALYVSTKTDRQRPGRRLGDSAPNLEARLVEVRAPAFGVVWQGLAGFRRGEEFTKWRGRTGWLARLLERFAAPLSRRGVFLARYARPVPLVANERVWVVSTPDGIRFTPEGDFDLRPAP